jgi:hypothetical protein
LKYRNQIQRTMNSQLQSLGLQFVCVDEWKCRSVNLLIVECFR